MLALDIAVTFDGGEKTTVEARTADFLAFETHFDKSFTALHSDMRLSYIIFLAWHTSKRTGATTLELDAWAETVSMVEAVNPKA